MYTYNAEETMKKSHEQNQ